MDSSLMVREILQRPQFEAAQVVAGKEGLDRKVRWVHIVEVVDVERFVNGEELILTTGIPITMDETAAVQFLDKLIRNNVSCLCIELGEHFSRVPQSMLDRANERHFPLIVFPQIVRFVDITQDVHSLIINRHHLILQDLERISKQFYRLTLTSQGVSSVLKLLQTSTKAQVAYIPLQGQTILVPMRSAQDQASLLEQLKGWLDSVSEDSRSKAPYLGEIGDSVVLAQTVGALGKTWAYLVLLLDRKPQERDYLILDSAALSVAQDLLRKRYIEERRLYTENLWVDDLLHARFKGEEQLKAVIGDEFRTYTEAEFQVCSIEFAAPQDAGRRIEEEGEESTGLHVSLLLRALFEQTGFLPLMTLKNNRLVVAALNKSPKKPVKGRIRQVLDQLLALQEEDKLGDIQLRIGVGRVYRNLLHVPSSYKESIQAIALYPCLDKPILYYDELGVYQLLHHIQDRETLSAYVHHHLGPLMDHDASKGSELVRTLQVFLNQDGSKQLAAEQLFIVRQSLYYRLRKIAELIGPDYMDPDKKLALQLAFRAYAMIAQQGKV